VWPCGSSIYGSDIRSSGKLTLAVHLPNTSKKLRHHVDRSACLDDQRRLLRQTSCRAFLGQCCIIWLCMNAATNYSAPLNWILSHVTEADMFLVQSAVTCCALFWFVCRLCVRQEVEKNANGFKGFSIVRGLPYGSRFPNSLASSVSKSPMRQLYLSPVSSLMLLRSTGQSRG
jgi:hypothetical protein